VFGRASPPESGGVAASIASRRGGSKAASFRNALLKRCSKGTTPSAPSARPPLLTQEGTRARIRYRNSETVYLMSCRDPQRPALQPRFIPKWYRIALMREPSHIDAKTGGFIPWAHATFTILLVVFFLAPTILCAVPGRSMSADEHECCKHMKERCGDPSISSCCAMVPNAALGTVTISETAASLPDHAIQQAVVAYADIVLPAQIASPTALADVTPSPPLSPTPTSIQVLRI
jgi:hypothetical protein